MEKVLIIGANGFLGLNLLTQFSGSYETYGADLNIEGIPTQIPSYIVDITDKTSIKKVIDRIKPDLTILSAAMTNVDLCEEEPKKAELINALGPKYVAEAVKPYGRLIYISTDFVFDGNSGNYSEADNPNPISIYGLSKLKGEKYIMESDVEYCICRTSVLYGWPASHQRDNFFSWVYKQLYAKNKLSIIDGQITTPTLVEDLSACLFRLTNFKNSHIFHTAGPDALTRYNFVKKILGKFQFDPNLLHKINNFPQKAKRPENSSLNTEKIRKLGIRFHSVDESLEILKSKRQKYSFNIRDNSIH